MLLESRGEYAQAQALYEEIRQINPVNHLAWKRSIKCQEKLEGTNAAMKSLIEYVQHFSADVEAWQEMARLYQEENMYDLPQNDLSHKIAHTLTT